MEGVFMKKFIVALVLVLLVNPGFSWAKSGHGKSISVSVKETKAKKKSKKKKQTKKSKQKKEKGDKSGKTNDEFQGTIKKGDVEFNLKSDK